MPDFGLRLACYTPGGALRGYARGQLIERYARAGEAGRLLVDFTELAPRSELFATRVGGVAVGLEVGVEYMSAAGWVEPEDGRYVIGTDAHERVEDPTHTHDLSLLGITQLLNGPKVFTATPEQTDEHGKRKFLSQTPGAIIRTLATEAQARGSLPGVTLGFTATHDSRGQAWPQIFNRAYELSHSILGVLQNLWEGGAVDYWTEGRTLHMVPAGARGRDLTTGLDPVYLRDRHVKASPEREDWTHLATHAALIGDEGARWERANPAAITPWGRQETVIIAGGVSDAGTAQIMMDRALAEGADVGRQITREWDYTSRTRWMPDRDIRIGDWVLADTTAGKRQRVRVADLMCRQGPDGIEAFVTLGTVADDAITRLAKRQLGIEGGAGVGSMGRPAPPPQEPAKPAKATSLVVLASSWVTAEGHYRGQIDASWAPVTVDVDGKAMEPSAYVLYGRRTGPVGRPEGAWIALARTEATEATASPDDMAAGDIWEFKVHALSDSVWGDMSDVVQVTVPLDNQAPQIPSAPTVSSSLGMLTVEWDGLSQVGGGMDADLDHLRVQITGQAQTWRMDKVSRTVPIGGLDVGTSYEVTLVAVDNAGNESAPSQPSGSVTVVSALTGMQDAIDQFEAEFSDASRLTEGYLDVARIKIDAAWVERLLIGSAGEVVVDPTWSKTALNADRSRTGWTVSPGVVAKTTAGGDDFMLGLTSAWPVHTSQLPLRPGTRYRITAQVRLTTAGSVGLVSRDTGGGYGYVTGPVALAANTTYTLVGEHVATGWPGSYGVRLDQPGYIYSVSVQPMLSQVLIQDGLITSPKIAADGVKADNIDAGAVTALKLHVDALNFKAATGMNLTSPHIQTTAEALRGLKINTTHLRSYNNDGIETFRIEYGSGAVFMAGDFKTGTGIPNVEIRNGVWADFIGMRFNTDPLASGSQTEVKSNYAWWNGSQPGNLFLSCSGVVGNDSEIQLDPNFTKIMVSKNNVIDSSIEIHNSQLIPGDIILDAAGAILLTPGNNILEFRNIPAVGGGDTLVSGANWRVGYLASMRKLKRNITPIDAPYELLSVPVVEYQDATDYAELGADAPWYVGIVAEDVQEVAAKSRGLRGLTHSRDVSKQVDHRRRQGPQPPPEMVTTVDYPRLGALLLKIVADMNRRLANLETPRRAA